MSIFLELNNDTNKNRQTSAIKIASAIVLINGAKGKVKLAIFFLKNHTFFPLTKRSKAGKLKILLHCISNPQVLFFE